MARTFSSGTATDGGGSVSTNSATLQGLIRDALVANAAWTLVEEFTGSGGTMRNTVFKCASGASGLPKDFYLIIQRTIAGGAWSMFMAEDYDPATHIATNIPPAWISGNRTFDANGLPNPATTANIAATQVLTNTPAIYGPAILASQFWAVIADTDHCVIVIGGTAYYIGAVTAFATGSATDPMPVGFLRLSSSTTAPNSSFLSSFTRHPGAAGTTTSGQNATLTDPGHQNSVILVGQTLAFTSGPDKLHDNKNWAYEVIMVYSSSAAATYGYIRGKLKKTGQVGGAPAGSAVGDTFTMDGNKWLVCGVPGTGSVVVCDTGAP